MSIDEHVSVVGSSNMDIRWIQLELELSLRSCGRAFSDEMRALEDQYRAVSKELTVAEWGRRTRGHRLLDNLARLTSAIM
jgi:cardiolipin synthase